MQKLKEYYHMPHCNNCFFVSAGGDPDAEPGARLTCHLIRRLFKKAYSPPGVYHIGNPPAVPANSTTRRNMYYIKYPCDRHLLSAIHSGMRVEAILAVLKGFLVIGKFGIGQYAI